MAYTSDDLVASVRRRGQLPDASADGKLTDLDILALADEEISLLIYPLVTAAGEEYWITGEVQSVVAGTSNYLIPSRATAGTLRDLQIKDPTDYVSVPMVDLDNAWRYANGNTLRFHVYGNFVQILPTPTTSTATLLFLYARQHSRLVPVASCAKVTGIAGAVYTCDSVPAAWSTSNKFDSIQAVPNFSALGDSTEPSGVVTGASGTLTYSDPITYASVDDYFALANETCVMQIPRELHPLLISATLVRVLEAIGDKAAVSVAQALMERQILAAKGLIEPRVKGAAKRIINRSSSLRGGR